MGGTPPRRWLLEDRAGWARGEPAKRRVHRSDDKGGSPTPTYWERRTLAIQAAYQYIGNILQNSWIVVALQ